MALIPVFVTVNVLIPVCCAIRLQIAFPHKIECEHYYELMKDLTKKKKIPRKIKRKPHTREEHQDLHGSTLGLRSQVMTTRKFH